MLRRGMAPAMHSLLSVCMLAWRTAAYVNIPFSSTYYGVDGPVNQTPVLLTKMCTNECSGKQFPLMSVDG